MNAKTIDGFAFSRSGSELHLEFGLSEFDRVADVLVQADLVAYPSVKATVVGSRSAEGRCYLGVAVDATLPMVCQRCLEVVAVPLHFVRRLELVRSETGLSDNDVEDDSIDVIVSGSDMLLKELVEDEVLLALPMVAMHDDCSAPDLIGE